VEYVVLLPAVEHCVARVATRRGHGFTDEAATRHMHEQFATAGIERRHVFIDPPDRAEAIAEHIMTVLDTGALTYRNSH
jgi:hypothetical protein